MATVAATTLPPTITTTTTAMTTPVTEVESFQHHHNQIQSSMSQQTLPTSSHEQQIQHSPFDQNISKISDIQNNCNVGGNDDYITKSQSQQQSFHRMNGNGNNVGGGGDTGDNTILGNDHHQQKHQYQNQIQPNKQSETFMMANDSNNNPLMTSTSSCENLSCASNTAGHEESSCIGTQQQQLEMKNPRQPFI
ncbi:hypothetical protein BLA29_008668 [Euroglyphus maynei]|uniref:Uncharacterized protein n=1 Tax=Euroglyphus maynei TaxID=6958 RepID=A0A1Y3ART6_EURMA|nr:hypothetical protein BLA29_008668 [Euroglyphus maynei]